MLNVLKLFAFISTGTAFLGAFSSRSSLASEVDWVNTIRVGESQVYNLIGSVSSEELHDYLAPLGKVPKSTLGRSMVVLSVFENQDVEGCGCPKKFNEFTMVYLVDENGPTGETQISPDFQLTNHVMRQTSVAFKFGTMVDLGVVGFTGDRGFHVYDEDGALVLKARPKGGMPKPRFPEMIRYGSHSLGGVQQGVRLTPTYSKISGPIHAGYRPFVKGLDTFYVNPSSKLGRHLNRLKFVPHIWQSMQARSDMWVWRVN